MTLDLDSLHPETQVFPFPSRGEGRVGVITNWNLIFFFLVISHPTPLPQGERGFPDEN